MSNEEAKVILRTMQGLLSIACGDAGSQMSTKFEEAVNIAITAIEMQDMKIENSEED